MHLCKSDHDRGNESSSSAGLVGLDDNCPGDVNMACYCRWEKSNISVAALIMFKQTEVVVLYGQ